MEDRYECRGMTNCPAMECSEDVCLNYGDCIWCHNKNDKEVCEGCKYKGGGRYAEKYE